MTDLSKADAALTAPSLGELLTQPSAFFQKLSALPPRPTRYLWLVALTSLVSGVATTLLSRNALQVQSTLLSGASGGTPISPLFNYGAAVFAAIFITALLWLLLWGLGTLGAGKEGRAAEVYGATFLPLLVWAVILLPLAALFAPQITVPIPNLSGLSGLELQRAIQQYAQATQAELGSSLVSRLSTYLGYAVYLWQFALAYIGFRVLTANAGKAWRGVLFPAALLLVVGLAGWLLSRAVTGLTSGS